MCGNIEQNLITRYIYIYTFKGDESRIARVYREYLQYRKLPTSFLLSDHLCIPVHIILHIIILLTTYFL